MYEEKDQNYVYSISIREIEKYAIALNLPMIVYKSYTDIYDRNLNNGHIGSPNFYKLRIKILFRELLAKLRLDGNTMIQIAVFKILPSEAVRSAMKANGWTLRDLPRNPYLA